MTDVTAAEIPEAPMVEADNSDAVQETVSQEPEVSVLSLDEYADYRVPIKVGGEEQLVPITEALSGYQRQADYTRKTQELAELREQAEYGLNLAAALEEDPAKTLAILQTLFREEDVAQAEDELLDPQEKRLRQVETFIQAQEQSALEAQIQSQLDTYNQQFGVEPDEVLQHALDLNLGPAQLDLAVRSLMFEKSQVAQVQAEAKAAEAAAEQAAAQAKGDASFIAGGSSTAPDATQTQISTSNDPADVARSVWKRFGLL